MLIRCRLFTNNFAIILISSEKYTLYCLIFQHQNILYWCCATYTKYITCRLCVGGLLLVAFLVNLFSCLFKGIIGSDSCRISRRPLSVVLSSFLCLETVFCHKLHAVYLRSVVLLATAYVSCQFGGMRLNFVKSLVGCIADVYPLPVVIRRQSFSNSAVEFRILCFHSRFCLLPAYVINRRLNSYSDDEHSFVTSHNCLQTSWLCYWS